MKKFDEAMITFDKALVLNPRYISVINNKGINNINYSYHMVNPR